MSVLVKLSNNLNVKPKQALLNLLRPTGHVMHQQYNIQQL
jgi:hypothetical protein